MSATLVGGPRVWSMSRDEEGHREYKITFIAKTSSTADGPQAVFYCPGLPLTGQMWNYGNDLDRWALCLPTMSITLHEHKEGEPHVYWKIDQTFSTNRKKHRCQDTEVEDPLLEPMRISGSFTKYTKEVTHDKDGNPIKNSAHEMLRGNVVEFDHNRATVKIEQNVLRLSLATFSQMINTVNDRAMWGLPSRTIKLANVSWERKLYGSCTFYFTRSFEFEVDYCTRDSVGNLIGFDKELLDEGSKCAKGHWDVNPASATFNKYIVEATTDPLEAKDCVRYKDKSGELARVILDGHGYPADAPLGGTKSGTAEGPGAVDVAYYRESNFLILGIPTILD